jgi:hypothetical protein
MFFRDRLEDGDLIDVTLRKATTWENFLWVWRASNPVNRVAGRLAMLSVLLGAVGGPPWRRFGSRDLWWVRDSYIILRISN